MISEPCGLSGGSLDPSPLGDAIPSQPQGAMPTAEVVNRPYKPHARLKRTPLTSRRPSPPGQRRQPGAEGGLKSLDVGCVDHRAFTSLCRGQPGVHRRLRTAHDAPKDPDHSSPSVALDRLGDHEALRQKESWTTPLAGAKRLAQHAQSLLRVARKSVSAKQQALKCSTSTHTSKERPDQVSVALYSHHAAEPQPATNRDRRGQPHHATDDPYPQLIGLNLRQRHSSGLDDVLVKAPALLWAHQLPAMDGAFVQTEGRNDGLQRAAVGHQGHDGRAEKEERRAPLRSGDVIPEGRLGRPRFGLRRGEGPIPLQRRTLCLLTRARRVEAREEAGQALGVLNLSPLPERHHPCESKQSLRLIFV